MRWASEKGHPLRPSSTSCAATASNQRATEREERFVDVGALVVTDAQAPELVEPGKGAFHDRPRPIDPVVTREPIEKREVDQIPYACLLPIAQAPPARHPRPAAEFPWEQLPGDSGAEDKRMPVRHARSETRGRPPLGRLVGVARTVRQVPHNGSESSAAAIRFPLPHRRV